MAALTDFRRFLWHGLRRFRAAVLLGPRAAWGLVLMAAYLLAILGYPAGEPQAGVAGKDGSEPFPCQFSACGCRTAEQCRKSCCCHSKSDKITWAVERGIDPNRVAVISAEESASLTLRVGMRALVTRSVSEETRCVSEDIARAPSPRQKSGCCSTSANTAPRSAGWVIGIKALDCRGTGSDWIAAGFVALTLEEPLPVQEAPSHPAPCFVAQCYSPPLPGRLDRPG